jgi:hypothetical protein
MRDKYPRLAAITAIIIAAQLLWDTRHETNSPLSRFLFIDLPVFKTLQLFSIGIALDA